MRCLLVAWALSTAGAVAAAEDVPPEYAALFAAVDDQRPAELAATKREMAANQAEIARLRRQRKNVGGKLTRARYLRERIETIEGGGYFDPMADELVDGAAGVHRRLEGGRVGWSLWQLRVVQIIGDRELLAGELFGGRLYWIVDHETAGLADGDVIRADFPLYVDGVRPYTSLDGGERNPRRLVRLDPERIKKLWPMWAAERKKAAAE